MKEGWQFKKIGDVCKTGAGGTPLKIHKDYYDGGNIPWLLSGEVSQMNILSSKNFITKKGLDNSSAKLFPRDTVLVAMYGANAGQVGILRFEAATNQAVCGILPNNNINTEFLYYYLLSKQEDLAAQAVGGAQPNISQIKVKNTVIPVPPLSEQRRIVALLDEAFTGIAAAKEKAEQNLKNAKEVFESAINSIEGKKVNLGDYVEIKTGKLDANAAEENGKYPFFTCSREIFSINNFSFDCEAILLAGNNAVGDFNVKYFNGKFNAYQRTYVITANNKRQILCKYLYIQLLNSLKKFKEKSVGAATKFLKLGMIKEMQIILPSLLEQETIISYLSCIQERTEKLESIYQQKLSNLEELKKSLLQQAFSGAL